MLLIPLPVVMNQMFTLTFVNNLYSLHAGQPITHVTIFFLHSFLLETHLYVNIC